MPKIELHKGLSKKQVSAIARQTLASCDALPRRRRLRLGDTMPDGSIYAGISPDTGIPFYATPADAPGLYLFPEAIDYAAALDAHWHKDWRVPSRAELNVLRKNRKVIGGLKLTDTPGSYHPDSYYWTAEPTDAEHAAWAQRFSDGQFHGLTKTLQPYGLRCVRSEESVIKKPEPAQ